jgi:hypothetical protein
MIKKVSDRKVTIERIGLIVLTLKQRITMTFGEAVASVILALLHLTPVSANAKILRLDFNGSIQNLAFFNGATEDFGLKAGSKISGSILFDSSTPNTHPNPGTQPDPDKFFWQYSIVSVQIGDLINFREGYSYTYVRPPDRLLQYYANAVYINSDQISGVSDVMTANFISKEIATLQGRLDGLTTEDFRLDESNLQTLHSIPLASGLYKTTIFDAKISSIVISKVPVPATLALLGLGLVGIGAARRMQA